jgi:hypothetical protein
MPLSSLSIVAITIVATNWIGRKKNTLKSLSGVFNEKLMVSNLLFSLN